jgi:hypothetical protein
MITIFCIFCQFSAKKLAFFSKTNDTIKVLQKVAAEQKTPIFLPNFSAKIF